MQAKSCKMLPGEAPGSKVQKCAATSLVSLYKVAKRWRAGSYVVDQERTASPPVSVLPVAPTDPSRPASSLIESYPEDWHTLDELMAMPHFEDSNSPQLKKWPEFLDKFHQKYNLCWSVASNFS